MGSGVSTGLSMAIQAVSPEELHATFLQMEPAQVARVKHALAKLQSAAQLDGYDYIRPTSLNYRVDGSREVFGPFASIRSALDFEYHGCYSAERQLLQDKIVSDCIGTGTIHEHPWLVFTAGAMGAGKGHTIDWMSKQGYFPLPDIVRVDPDKFRTELPEWPGYLARDPLTAGGMTHRESGYIVEIAQEAALNTRKNVWVDGSLRDADWYSHVFKTIREKRPGYRLAIIHVMADWHTVCARAASRAEKTGRVVPKQSLRESFEQVPSSVDKLAPLADFVAHIDNTSTPQLIKACMGSECYNPQSEWDAIRERFADLVELKSSENNSWIPSIIDSLVSENPVFVFSKSFCSYSVTAKEILFDFEGELHIAVVELDRTTSADRGGARGAAGVAIQMALSRKTGQQTCPQVFIAGKFIGGCDEVKKLSQSGSLRPLISAAVGSRTGAARTIKLWGSEVSQQDLEDLRLPKRPSTSM